MRKKVVDEVTDMTKIQCTITVSLYPAVTDTELRHVG